MDLNANRSQIIATLKMAVSVIEGLVDQQAMEDNWYKFDLAKIKLAIEELEKE